MLRPVLVSPPAADPVDLAELKAHLRIDFDDENDELSACLAAAISHFDGWNGTLGRCLISQGWRLDLPCFPSGGCIRLPFPDVSEIAIAYSDSDNANQTLSASAYSVHEDAGRGLIVIKTNQSWPATFSRPDAVRIGFTAGYGTDAVAVPATLRHAIKIRAADLFARREDALKPGGLVDILTAPYRRTHIGAVYSPF